MVSLILTLSEKHSYTVHMANKFFFIGSIIALQCCASAVQVNQLYTHIHTYVQKFPPSGASLPLLLPPIPRSLSSQSRELNSLRYTAASHYEFLSLGFVFCVLGHEACKILVPHPEIESGPSYWIWA